MKKNFLFILLITFSLSLAIINFCAIIADLIFACNFFREGGEIIMSIIVKNRGNESVNDLIKRFKKISVSLDINTLVRDRQYHLKPSQVRKNAVNDNRRLRRRLRGLKKMKNISPDIITRMHDKLSSGK